jgi:hypothetical protein
MGNFEDADSARFGNSGSIKDWQRWKVEELVFEPRTCSGFCEKRTMLLGTEELNRDPFSSDFLMRSAGPLPSEIPTAEFVLALREAIHANEDDRALFRCFHLPANTVISDDRRTLNSHEHHLNGSTIDEFEFNRHRKYRNNRDNGRRKMRSVADGD